MSYPITLTIDQPPERTRLTSFFRLLIALIPGLMSYVVGLLLYVVVIIAWFALLLTGRWPAGLYNFATGALRFLARYMAYAYLAVDAFPPLNLSDDPNYPVRLVVDPPLAQYSRLKVFFRGIYALPAMIIAYVLIIAIYLLGIASWFAILFTGRQPEGLQNGLRFCLSYVIKAVGLYFLVAETYPSFEG